MISQDVSNFFVTRYKRVSTSPGIRSIANDRHPSIGTSTTLEVQIP